MTSVLEHRILNMLHILKMCVHILTFFAPKNDGAETFLSEKGGRDHSRPHRIFLQDIMTQATKFGNFIGGIEEPVREYSIWCEGGQRLFLACKKTFCPRDVPINFGHSLTFLKFTSDNREIMCNC